MAYTSWTFKKLQLSLTSVGTRKPTSYYTKSSTTQQTKQLTRFGTPTQAAQSALHNTKSVLSIHLKITRYTVKAKKLVLPSRETPPRFPLPHFTSSLQTPQSRSSSHTENKDISKSLLTDRAKAPCRPASNKVCSHRRRLQHHHSWQRFTGQTVGRYHSDNSK